MEKELLILGIIRGQRIHGYRLWELLSAVPMGVRLRRSNAYRILDNLEKKGLVNQTIEREGNRPQRRVYEISEEGERAFQRMLRDSLGDDAACDLPNAVALNYLDGLAPDEAVELLKRRLRSIETRIEANDELSAASLRRHPGVAFAVEYDSLEHRFVSGLIDRLSEAA